MVQWVKDAGESECQSVVAWIGAAKKTSWQRIPDLKGCRLPAGLNEKKVISRFQ